MAQGKPWKNYIEPLGLVLCLTVGKALFLPGVKEATGLPLDLQTLGLLAYAGAYLLRRLRRGGGFFRGYSRFFLVFMAVLAFWLVYGAAGLLLSPYTEPGEGARQLYYLAMGMCTVLCVYECASAPEGAERLLRVFGWACGGLILLCLTESFVGFHLPGSKYADPGLWSPAGTAAPAGLYAPTLFLSSGFDYNCNDMAARVGILLPTLFVTGSERPWEKVLRTALVLLGLYVMVVNDSNVVLVAMLLCFFVYGILRAQARWATAAALGGTLWLTLGKGAAAITDGLMALKARLWPAGAGVPWERFVHSGPLTIRASLVESGTLWAGRGDLDKITASAAQADALVNTNPVQLNRGSLVSRLRICLDSWDMALDTRFLGVGPHGYGWFETHPMRTRYMDPHCWYLEVLSQYGLAVFLSYFGCLVTMYGKMILRYRRNRRGVYAVVIAMCSAFVLACVAPSSFLRFAYPWALPGLCLALLNRDDAKE